jgi:hypothetical protein
LNELVAVARGIDAGALLTAWAVLGVVSGAGNDGCALGQIVLQENALIC